MIFAALQSAASALASVATWAMPAASAVSPETAAKRVNELLNDLKVIEEDRKAELKKADRKPKSMADPLKMEELSVFSMVDSLFIEYHNYYNAINILARSDEKSTDSHKVLATIDSSRERSIQLYISIIAKQEKHHQSTEGPDSQMHLLSAIFKDTIRKNAEIEAQLRVEFENSPFIKHMKNVPNVSPI